MKSLEEKIEELFVKKGVEATADWRKGFSECKHEALTLAKEAKEELIKTLCEGSIQIWCSNCAELTEATGKITEDDPWSHCLSLGCGCGYVILPCIDIDKILGKFEVKK